jgi:hypothetical protein
MSDISSPPEATEQAVVFTPASTVDELIKAAYFVATGIDAPVVDAISQHQINLHYPADGSLVSVKIEGRPGAWGGIGPHGTPEDETARNEHYDAMAASVAPPEQRQGLAEQERRSDAHAREDAKPQEPREDVPQPENPNPTWEVQRQ